MSSDVQVPIGFNGCRIVRIYDVDTIYANNGISYTVNNDVATSLYPKKYARRSYFIQCCTGGNVAFYSWWRHPMDTFSALLAMCAGNSPVPGEVPTQRPVTRSFGVFFDLRLNKRLTRQWWGWWFETTSRPLWRHCNVCQYPSAGSNHWYWCCHMICTNISEATLN